MLQIILICCSHINPTEPETNTAIQEFLDTLPEETWPEDMPAFAEFIYGEMLIREIAQKNNGDIRNQVIKRIIEGHYKRPAPRIIFLLLDHDACKHRDRKIRNMDHVARDVRVSLLRAHDWLDTWATTAKVNIPGFCDFTVTSGVLVTQGCRPKILDLDQLLEGTEQERFIRRKQIYV